MDKEHFNKAELESLRVLIDNSRETLSTISKKTGAPLSTVRNKFNGLVSKGTIKGFTAFLDARKPGMVGAVFFVKCGRNYGKVVDAASSHPNVRWVMELVEGARHSGRRALHGAGRNSILQGVAHDA